MSQLDPTNTSASDLCTAALSECGAWGSGTVPTTADLNDAQARLQWMLQTWQRKRYVVYSLVTLGFVSTGAQYYSIGPGGNFDTTSLGVGSTYAVNAPEKIESAYFRQLTQSQPNQIDYPLTVINSLEDYNRIALKQLQTFPTHLYYQRTHASNPGGFAVGLGTIMVWPIPNSAIYEVFVSIKQPLPLSFFAGSNFTAALVLPYELYDAIVTNLAMRLRPKYGIISYQGDTLPGRAKEAMQLIRQANDQVRLLHMSDDLLRPGVYNIFSDRNY